MKKLLTTAALLTIGTAASFATEFTFSGTGTFDSTSVSGGRAAFATITLDDGTTLSNGDILDGSLYDWSISFSITGFNATEDSGDSESHQRTLFSVDRSGGSGSGYGVIAYEDSDGIYYSLTSVTQNHDDSPSIIGNSSSAYSTDYGQTITISWDAVASTISLSVAGTLVASTTTSTAVSLITEADSDSSTNSGSATTFWTNSGDNPITGITLSVTETPEPSMFGLFAGLGAIGLVAARRRRNRKA